MWQGGSAEASRGADRRDSSTAKIGREHDASNEKDFRGYFVVGLVSEFLFISLVLALYRLLKGVNQQHAALMVMLVLMTAPLAFVGTANQVATLAFVRGAESLTVFDKPQRDAVAMPLNAEKEGTLVAQIFWGLWILALGLLVFRSGLLPRILNVRP
jgi:hypothetical protein